LKRAILLSLLVACGAAAQVYSPKVLVKDQPDASDLRLLTQGIYRQAGAHTPRERAEAIWRFFLTDGRFVKPGFWYHIAGWAYEEPMGEVLDATKLLNSYGFGLCYQVAPVLEAVWRAGGFEDARVWFLTGHTVAEVFYDGGYHHYDSDMLGYNTIGRGPAKQSPVASLPEVQAAGFEALHYEIDGPHRMVTTTAGQGWRMPTEYLKPTETLTRSGLFGPWDAPDLGVDPLPGINPGRRKHWGLDSFQVWPNFVILIWERGWYLTYHYWPTSYNTHVFEGNLYFVPPKNARERVAQEMAAVTFKEFALQDGNTLEATQIMLESRVVTAFPLNDQEILCRHLHKVTADWIAEYERENAEVSK